MWILDVIFTILGISLSCWKIETERNQFVAFLFLLLAGYLILKLVYSYQM